MNQDIIGMAKGMIFTMENDNKDEIDEKTIFKLISCSGDARSSMYEAFDYVKKGQYENAEKCLESADKSVIKAHNVQTGLIQNEARGIHTKVSLLMVHAQDHLMSTLLVKDMIKNMIYMQKEINQLKDNLNKEGGNEDK